LLNGLSLAEILSLNADSFDTVNRMITIPLNHRKLIMSRNAQIMRLTQTWQSLSHETDDIEALLNCTAIDAGLSAPEQINSETIRFSYIVFLVRQGIKLAELPKIIGPISPGQLISFGHYSPETSGLPLDEVELDILKSLNQNAAPL
jgi:polysaccharide biosynthesis transport protein